MKKKQHIDAMYGGTPIENIVFGDHPPPWVDLLNWLSGPFFKAVCKVNAKEFENAR